ncbi:MAG TPA: acyl-CoA dehydrogenase [Ramlibacter sp.]|uniref:acyl-CoA dehydrogenase n=1 Tax=Ramlibacter sp. TaxID=1917967 RepID=UPI002CD0996D|nr:acyl-CoA dehydrogenase [Ramlibacter sp.]HVZ44046.1 acyl-CoA dehydrogenase [Ramlibacter sp.]
MTSAAPLSFALSRRDVERLRSHAADADAAGTLHPSQRALIHHRGWLKMLAPREASGRQLPLPEAVRLEEAIAHADGSCGWVVTLCAGAGWFAGFLPPVLAKEVICTKRVCLAGSGAPAGIARRARDGWRITGRWDHASGAPLATHFTFNAVLQEGDEPLTDEQGRPRIRAFIAPSSQVRVVESWHAIGLRATASHSFRIDEAWLPLDHAFDIDAAKATAQGPLYRFPFLTLAYVTLAANLCGMARHFLELAGPIVAHRRHGSTGTFGDLPKVRALLERIEGDLGSTRERFLATLDAAWAHVEADATLPDRESSALDAASLDLVAASRSVVDGLYPWCGLRAADARTDVNRVWRDYHTATQHALLVDARVP